MQRATGAWLLIVGLWVGGTFLAAQAAYLEERAANRRMFRPPVPLGEEEVLIWDRLLNPPLAWSQLTFRFQGPYEYHDYDSFRELEPDGTIRSLVQVWPSVLGVLAYAVLSWVLYEAAARRFERDGR